MQAIIDTVAGWFATLFGWLQDAWGWVVDFFTWLGMSIFSGVVKAVTVVLAAIPVPDWFQNIDFSGVPPAVAYFGEPFRFGTGIGIMVSAYTIRFLIRRIPVIG